ncbi:UNVERIFIED_CONTAM: hypothetical protein HDU68_010835 [Siphonaria sp. JEL0065]|nr:hypothetical protein HDU68_010835 [Siphonaria sp. JEL0065]
MKNKDGDVNWLYGPFHTYEPLLQLQAAYKAAQNVQPSPVCGTPDCLGCPICSAHHQHTSHLKPALKNFTNGTNPTAVPANNPNLIRDLFLAGITRASSDPDLFSSSMQQQQAAAQQSLNPGRPLDFGATKLSIKTNFERQAAIAPLTGRKADFFLASAVAAQKAKLTASDRSTSEAGSMDSFGSYAPAVSPGPKTLRFAEEVVPVVAPSRTKVISFGVDDEDDEEDEDVAHVIAVAAASDIIAASRKAEFASALSDEESDLLVSQVPRSRDLDTDSDDDSDGDDNDGDFGINIRSTSGFGGKGIQVISSTTTTATFSHSSSIGLQRTPSAEKGLSKLSSLTSAIANNPSTTSGSSALGGLQRTSSFEKGLSKLSSLSKP